MQGNVSPIDPFEQRNGPLSAGDAATRKAAHANIRKRKNFQQHLAVYLAVNFMLVVIWAVTGAGYFWPIFPMLGWGVGIVAHGMYTRSSQITEADLNAEIARMEKRGTRPISPHPDNGDIQDELNR